MRKPQKNLAENCFKIVLSDFGRKIFWSNGEKQQKNGKFTIKNSRQKLFVSYSIFLDKRPALLKIWFTDNPKELYRGMGQEIEIEEDIATFGVRPYLKCTCENNAQVLYKPSDQALFSCRQCSNVKYESSSLNKSTMGGLFYYTHKLIKLANKRQQIDRMIYANKFTKKAQNLFNAYNKWSIRIPDEVRQLAELQVALAAKKQGDVQ